MGLLDDFVKFFNVSDAVRVGSLLSKNPAESQPQESKAAPVVIADAPPSTMGFLDRVKNGFIGAVLGAAKAVSNNWNRTNGTIVSFVISVLSVPVSLAAGALYGGYKGAQGGERGIAQGLDTIDDLTHPVRRAAVGNFESFSSILLTKQEVKNELVKAGVKNLDSPEGNAYLEKAMFSMKQETTQRLMEMDKQMSPKMIFPLFEVRRTSEVSKEDQKQFAKDFMLSCPLPDNLKPEPKSNSAVIPITQISSLLTNTQKQVVQHANTHVHTKDVSAPTPAVIAPPVSSANRQAKRDTVAPRSQQSVELVNDQTAEKRGPSMSGRR